MGLQGTGLRVDYCVFTHRGCQTQEKIVAASAATFVLIGDYR